MQQARMRITLIALPLCLAACQRTTSSVPARAPAQPKTPTVAHLKDERYIALGEIRSRDRIIVILSGPNGPAYTVKSEDGTILATRLSEAEILARFPELGDAIAEGFIASRWHPVSRDASLDVPPVRVDVQPRTIEPLTLTPSR